MNAASLHSALFGGATEVEVGRRIGRFRLFNVPWDFTTLCRERRSCVPATSFTFRSPARQAHPRRRSRSSICGSLSSSLMAVFIALLSGISGAAALIAIFGVKPRRDASGLPRERYEQPGERCPSGSGVMGVFGPVDTGVLSVWSRRLERMFGR